MKFKNMIVAAANKITVIKNGKSHDLILVDNCHFGNNMQAIIKMLRDFGIGIVPDHEDRGQGFIDESGNYHSRAESYKIARESGQPFNSQYTLPDNKLDSSCIRHFPDDSDLEDYMSRPVYCCSIQEILGKCTCKESGVVRYTSYAEEHKE